MGHLSGYAMFKARLAHNVNNSSADVSWMGGFMNMSSYAYQSLLGEHSLYGRVTLYQPMPFFLQADNKSTWLGFAAEAGKVSDVHDQSETGWHYSGVAYIASILFLGRCIWGPRTAITARCAIT